MLSGSALISTDANHQASGGFSRAWLVSHAANGVLCTSKLCVANNYAASLFFGFYTAPHVEDAQLAPSSVLAPQQPGTYRS